MTTDAEGLLPSFKEQLAVVYDDYVATLGGGERSALAYAKALQDLGFSVELVSTLPLPAPGSIARAFGREFDQVVVRQCKTDNVAAYFRDAGLGVFVNHTFMSFQRNPARLGIYAQMFPASTLTARTHPAEVANLRTYQLVLSNSSFTKRYTDALWDVEPSRSRVLHPPIAAEYTDAVVAMGDGVRSSKAKAFVSVGRFNPGTHNKNQKILIEAFLTARSRYPAMQDWTLSLIGNSNADEASRRYLAECQQLATASKGAVKLLHDVPETDLRALLSDAYGYVHATGAFHLPGQEPHKCEHLGLSIAEGMAHGCIPLVYARGGIFDILQPGVAGLAYITLEGLVEGFQEVARLYGSPEGEAMQRAAAKASLELSFARFRRRLADLISQEYAR